MVDGGRAGEKREGKERERGTRRTDHGPFLSLLIRFGHQNVLANWRLRRIQDVSSCSSSELSLSIHERFFSKTCFVPVFDEVFPSSWCVRATSRTYALDLERTSLAPRSS